MATKEFMNVRETAKRLGVHENTVRNWERSGVLRGFRLPGARSSDASHARTSSTRREMLGTHVLLPKSLK